MELIPKAFMWSKYWFYLIFWREKVWQRLIDRIPMYIHVCKGCNFEYHLPFHQNRFPRRAWNKMFRRAQIWSLSRKHLIRLRVYIDLSGLLQVFMSLYLGRFFILL